ncbi:MAG: sigma-70 family RNA polymerase sigma factor [Phocaeicola vulgatus]|nr:MAG: sigma-70 family RNA polymerase sigma factor [Phocaeicola vulgatus]
MDEQQLIEGCINRNRLAQRELYEHYSRRMLAVCLRYVNDMETAKDLLQDGFVKVFTSLDSYSGIGSFEGWMRKIFVNCALEYLRKSDVLRESSGLDNLPELSQPDSSVISNMSAAELMNIIKQLPAGFRTVFNLFAIEGYSHKEIGDMLGITESTSRSQYTRARQLLQSK